MNKCIVCDGDAGFEQLICSECKEALTYYKKLYWARKLSKETTELDETIFEQLYKAMDLDAIVAYNLEGMFPSSSAEDMMTDVENAIKDTIPKDHWLYQKEGRFDHYISYCKDRMQKKFDELNSKHA